MRSKGFPRRNTLTELEQILFKVVERSDEALSVTQVRRGLPKSFRFQIRILFRHLQALAKKGKLFIWKPVRGRKDPGSWKFSIQAPSDFVLDRIFASLRSGSATQAKIAHALPGYARMKVPAVLKELVRAGRVSQHPQAGRSRRYSLAPPDPLEYLKPKLDALVRRLEQDGFETHAVRDGLRRYLEIASPPVTVGEDQLQEKILETMLQLKPAARHGALVYIPELRRAVDAECPDKATFDGAILGLAASGRVQLQSHALPSQLSPAERETMIPNGRGGFFMAIGLRVE